VIAVATKGLRPEIPPDMTPEFMNIMRACWDENASKRPTFGALVEAFSSMKLPKPFAQHPKIRPNSREKLNKTEHTATSVPLDMTSTLLSTSPKTYNGQSIDDLGYGSPSMGDTSTIND